MCDIHLLHLLLDMVLASETTDSMMTIYGMIQCLDWQVYLLTRPQV